MTTKTTWHEKRLVHQVLDPLHFVRKGLGGIPWHKQVEIIESVRDNPRTTVRSCEISGKSWTAAAIALWFLVTKPPATVITTAPTFRQVRDILWREIAAHYHAAKIPIGGELTQTGLDLTGVINAYGMAGKSFAIGLSTDEPERFQGFHNDNVLVIVDEASGVPESLFQAIENPLGGGFSRLLLIGNPSQVSGGFYDSFKSPLYNKIHISAFDTPNFATETTVLPFLISRQWVEERRMEWGEDTPLWQIYILGEFAEEQTDALISLRHIEAAQNRELDREGARIIGVDIARFGEDKSVAVVRSGRKILEVAVWSKTDLMESTGRVVQLIKHYEPEETRVDSIGLGAGVVDRLKEQGYRVRGVNVAAKAQNENMYSNLRAEMYWSLRQRFENGEIDIPKDPVLLAELSGLKMKPPNSRGQIVIEGKEDMKKRGMRSPDRADALALCFGVPLSSGVFKSYNYIRRR